MASKFKPPGIWLNVQHDSFYGQFNLSMRNYILSVSKRVVANYISSPEVSFLTSMLGKINNKTKLVFHFLDETTLEPSTKQTYGSMLKNLTFVKTFASGILVPKHYIWPVSADNYLQPYTSVVDDAHKAGLEIYAADFANDFTFSYNHSYDPLAEYLSSIDNGAFAVDGVLTDFPVTPSAERSFSKLKLLKNYLRSTISQERLNGLAMCCIEKNILDDIDLNVIINDFASRSARRSSFL